MVNPLVQNFLVQRQQAASQQNAANKPVVHPVYPKGLTASTPKGYLVEENIIQAAGSNIKEYVDSAKYFYNAAFKAKGSDYSVGKINDLTLRLGSLGIAAILAAGKGVSPLRKGMEFVGLASWFGTMALWPKIVGAPIKALKGVDINQKYVDSYGRRKRFYEDPQYLNWDLMSDEQINKVADKLGIPKDIKNRRKATQEKMKQIAVQGNTLTMLTAGFATPVIGSLVADQLSKPVSSAIENTRIQVNRSKMAKTAYNINQVVEPQKESLNSLRKQINELTARKVNLRGEEAAAVDKAIVEKRKQLQEIAGEMLDKLIGEGNPKKKGVYEKIEQFCASKEISSKEDIEKLKALFAEGIPGFGHITDYSKELDNLYENAPIKAVITDKEIENAKKIFDLSDDVADEIFSKVKGKNLGRAEFAYIEGSLIRESEVDDLYKKVDDFVNAFKNKRSVDTEKVKKLYRIADSFSVNNKTIERFVDAAIANKEDSATANMWKRLPQKVVNALEIRDKKLMKQLINGDPDAEQGIINHLENLKKQGRLEAVAKKLEKAIFKSVNREENLVVSVLEAYEDLGDFGKLVSDVGFEDFGKSLNRMAGNGFDSAINKVVDTRSSFYRVFKILDLFDRDADINLKKIAVAGSGIDNFTNKFQEYGVRTKNQFEVIMNDLFAPLGERISNSLKDVNKDAVNRHNKAAREIFGQIDNPILPDVKVSVNPNRLEEVIYGIKSNGIRQTSEDLALQVGKSFKGLLIQGAQNSHSYKKWLRFAGGMGIGIVALSMLAISQFGKKNKYNPDIYESKGGSLNVSE